MAALPSNIRLYVRSPLGSTVDYGRYDGIALSISDVTPGGYDTAEFTICNPNNDLPALGSKVWVYDETTNRILWLGRVEGLNIDFGTGPTRVTCNGYVDSMDDDGFDHSQVYPAGSSFESIIQHAVSSLCPELSAGGIDFQATGLNIAEDTSDYALQSAKQVIENLMALTTHFTTPMLYHVWETTPNFNYPKLYFSFQDPQARYRILLNDQVTLRSDYDIHSVINKSVVQWGNQQFVTIPASINYDVIPVIRSKRVNAENDIRVHSIAENMAEGFLNRFNMLRAVTDTITVCAGNAITAIYPITSAPSVIDNAFPLYLVHSGYAIDVLNIDSKFRPYTSHVKFIVGKRYEFETGTLTLQCGEIVTLGTSIRALSASLTSRPFVTSAFSAISQPLVDNDQLPVYGPSFDGISPPSFSAGTPVFVKAPNDERAPDGAVIHPNLIADEGLEANITIGDLSEGPKGGIKTIPGLYTGWDAYFDNDDVEDTIEIKIYKKARVPDNSTLQLIDTIRITGKHGHGPFQGNQKINMLKGDRFFFEVTVAANTAQICSLSLNGPKRYPGLKI